MTRTTTILVLAAAVGTGIGSFFATRAVSQPQAMAASPAAPIRQWLDLTDQQAHAIQEHDPEFASEAAQLEQELSRQREALIALLETPDSTDAAVLEQVERVIEAHNALELRVARHVVALRQHLTPAQQRQLMGLCARGVREAMGRRWRGGRGEAGPGPGAGRRRPLWQQP